MPLLGLTLLLSLAPLAYSQTPAGRHEAEEAERIVFLLQYVGSDYAAAVKDGVIVDEAEFRENKEFVSLISEGFDKIRASMPAPKADALSTHVTKLVELVSAHGDPRTVRQVTESAIPILIGAFDLHPFPKDRPDPHRARELYAENCTPCHGVSGQGDGPRAAELNPLPAKFTGRERMDTTAPYVFYNAITFGVANTAMASFRDAFTDQERWDLAFYLWTFTVTGKSPQPPPVVLSLRDLATRSPAELAPDVIRQAAVRGRALDVAQAKELVSRLRAEPPLLSDWQERLARLRQDLSRSVAMLEGGRLEEAAELVTNSYLAEFEPLEPEIDLRDREVRQRFERGLIDFRAALRQGDRQRALEIARGLQDTVEIAARLLSEERAKESSGRWIVLGCTALIAVLAVTITLVRRRTSVGKGTALG